MKNKEYYKRDVSRRIQSTKKEDSSLGNLSKQAINAVMGITLVGTAVNLLHK